jgi:5-methylcytosine-specific restriction endonuclease McrA
MGVKPSRYANKDPRWPALRLQALRRDDWKCRVCGSRVRLEVDHVEPVFRRPDLAFVLSNLQTLCARHHAEKTRRETGRERTPEQERWRTVVEHLRKQ